MASAGRTILLTRVGERCANCRAERSNGSHAPCRCGASARWQPFCTRCVRTFEGDLCPSCLAVAEANGRTLRAALDAMLARIGGLAGARSSLEKAKERVAATMREFAVRQVVTPLPGWAERLADRNAPLPPGVDRSRSKMAAVNELRLEVSAVQLALRNLGYSGQPADEKLERTLEQAEGAMTVLEGWDGLSAGSEHEGALRNAAEQLAAAHALIGTLLDTVRRRNLSPLIEAVLRRDRAMKASQRELGVR